MKKPVHLVKPGEESTKEKLEKFIFESDSLRKECDIRNRNIKEMPLYLQAHRRSLEKIDTKTIKEKNKHLVDSKIIGGSVISEKEIETEEENITEEQEVQTEDDNSGIIDEYKESNESGVP
jgi:hypothetical protein